MSGGATHRVARYLMVAGLIATCLAVVILAWPPTRLALMIGGDWGLATHDPLTQLGLLFWGVAAVCWPSGLVMLRRARVRPLAEAAMPPRGARRAARTRRFIVVESLVVCISTVTMIATNPQLRRFARPNLWTNMLNLLYYTAGIITFVVLFAFVFTVLLDEDRRASQ
jgi:hypothetical protein